MDRSSPASSPQGRGRLPTALRRRTSRRQRTAPQLIIVPRIHSAATLAGATRKEAAPAASVVIKMADLPRPPVSEVKRACPEKTANPLAAAVAPQAEAGVGANEASGIVHRFRATPQHWLQRCCDRARKITMSNMLANVGVKIRKSHRPVFITTLLLLCLLVCSSARADGSTGQKTFDSPEAAIDALVTAAEAGDMNTLRSILGGRAEPLLSSGDLVADRNARDNFAVKYREMHRIAYDTQGRVILYLGADNWPLPIPLMKNDGAWEFDTASGEQELLYRRIGQNELYTI